jgi:hypothetical protein
MAMRLTRLNRLIDWRYEGAARYAKHLSNIGDGRTIERSLAKLNLIVPEVRG